MLEEGCAVSCAHLPNELRHGFVPFLLRLALAFFPFAFPVMTGAFLVDGSRLSDEIISRRIRNNIAPATSVQPALEPMAGRGVSAPAE